MLLDKHIKHTIIKIYGRDTFSEDGLYIILENSQEKILYPDIDKVIDVKVPIKGALKHSFQVII